MRAWRHLRQPVIAAAHPAAGVRRGARVPGSGVGLQNWTRLATRPRVCERALLIALVVYRNSGVAGGRSPWSDPAIGLLRIAASFTAAGMRKANGCRVVSRAFLALGRSQRLPRAVPLLQQYICRGDRSSAAQLRAADDQERQLHGRAQAREFAGCISARPKRRGSGIVAIHAIGPPSECTAPSRQRTRLLLPYRKHLARFVLVTSRAQLPVLFTSNPCKRLAQVRIDAARVTKGMIENRFHCRLQAGRHAVALQAARCVPARLFASGFSGLHE